MYPEKNKEEAFGSPLMVFFFVVKLLLFGFSAIIYGIYSVNVQKDLARGVVFFVIGTFFFVLAIWLALSKKPPDVYEGGEGMKLLKKTINGWFIISELIIFSGLLIYLLMGDFPSFLYISILVSIIILIISACYIWALAESTAKIPIAEIKIDIEDFITKLKKRFFSYTIIICLSLTFSIIMGILYSELLLGISLYLCIPMICVCVLFYMFLRILEGFIKDKSNSHSNNSTI